MTNGRKGLRSCSEVCRPPNERCSVPVLREHKLSPVYQTTEVEMKSLVGFLIVAGRLKESASKYDDELLYAA